MSILSSRAAKWIVPIWLIVVGLIGLFGVPIDLRQERAADHRRARGSDDHAQPVEASATLAEVRHHASHVADRLTPPVAAEPNVILGV